MSIENEEMIADEQDAVSAHDDAETEHVADAGGDNAEADDEHDHDEEDASEVEDNDADEDETA